MNNNACFHHHLHHVVVILVIQHDLHTHTYASMLLLLMMKKNQKMRGGTIYAHISPHIYVFFLSHMWVEREWAEHTPKEIDYLTRAQTRVWHINPHELMILSFFVKCTHEIYKMAKLVSLPCTIFLNLKNKKRTINKTSEWGKKKNACMLSPNISFFSTIFILFCIFFIRSKMEHTLHSLHY